MAAFRIDSIEALARQMTFTPAETRLAQLGSAEALLHDIDPAKAYPLDFVIFRITGYHPKTVAGDLLTGMAARHDLGLLIERLSDTLDIQSAQLAEPVLSIDDVTEKFNVTTKTVQRWRRRGLPARRFVFPDGKRRVGFLLSSVDRFFATHRDRVLRGTNFSQVDDRERTDILRRARRLAGECGCCMAAITRRRVRFIDDSLFHQPDAAAAIDAIVSAETLEPPSRVEDRRVPSDLPAYLQELYRTPLLTPARERALFLKFNFHKFQF